MSPKKATVFASTQHLVVQASASTSERRPKVLTKRVILFLMAICLLATSFIGCDEAQSAQSPSESEASPASVPTPPNENDVSSSMQPPENPPTDNNAGTETTEPDTKSDEVQALLDSITVGTISKTVCPFDEAYLEGYGFAAGAAETGTVFTLLVQGNEGIETFFKFFSARYDLVDENGDVVKSSSNVYQLRNESMYFLLMRVANSVSLDDLYLSFQHKDEELSRNVKLSEETVPLDGAYYKSGSVNYSDIVVIDGRPFIIKSGSGESSGTVSSEGERYEVLSFLLAFVPLDSVLTYESDYSKFTFRLNEESPLLDSVNIIGITAEAPYESEIRPASLYGYDLILKISFKHTSETDLFRSQLREMHYLEYTGEPSFSLLL